MCLNASDTIVIIVIMMMCSMSKSQNGYSMMMCLSKSQDKHVCKAVLIYTVKSVEQSRRRTKMC
jgi:hypothetical protein